jgi:hypothetical protein
VAASRQYYINFEYHHQESEAKRCDYYSAHLSFTSYEQLYKEVQCLPHSHTVSFLDANDERMSVATSVERDGYIELRYPKDFKSKHTFQKVIDLQAGSSGNFDIDAQVYFDTPLSLFDMTLQNQVSQSSDKEDSAVQLHLEPDNGNVYSSTLIRDLKQLDLSSTKNYQLTIIDRVSFKILEHLTTAFNRVEPSDLCLYARFSLKLTSKKPIVPALASSSSAAMLTGTFPKMEKDKPHQIIGNKRELVVGLQFSK